MVEKVLLFIVNEIGELLDYDLPTFVARDKHINIIRVIAPFGADTVVYANFDFKASQSVGKSQYLKYVGEYKENPLYANYSVFESAVSSVITSEVSRFRAMPIGVSLSFSNRVQPSLATTYLRDFNLDNPLPNTANDNEFCIADGGFFEDEYYYEFTDKDIKFLKGDIAYFYNGKWRKANYKAVANMSSKEIPIEPSVETVGIVEEDEELVLQLAGDVANFDGRLGLAESEIESQAGRIEEIETDMGDIELRLDNIEQVELPLKADVSYVDGLFNNMVLNIGTVTQQDIEEEDTDPKLITGKVLNRMNVDGGIF